LDVASTDGHGKRKKERREPNLTIEGTRGSKSRKGKNPVVLIRVRRS